MPIQGTWADALIIQAVADALKVTYQLFLEPKWAIDSEPMRARGAIVLVKSN